MLNTQFENKRTTKCSTYKGSLVSFSLFQFLGKQESKRKQIIEEIADNKQAKRRQQPFIIKTNSAAATCRAAELPHCNTATHRGCNNKQLQIIQLGAQRMEASEIGFAFVSIFFHYSILFLHCSSCANIGGKQKYTNKAATK